MDSSPKKWTHHLRSGFISLGLPKGSGPSWALLGEPRTDEFSSGFSVDAKVLIGIFLPSIGLYREPGRGYRHHMSTHRVLLGYKGQFARPPLLRRPRPLLPLISSSPSSYSCPPPVHPPLSSGPYKALKEPHKALKELDTALKGLIRPSKGIIRPLKGLIRPLQGLVRPSEGFIRLFSVLIRLFKRLIKI